jgi:hypothetical protein
VIPGDSLLAIYLNDHLAGATGGLELARRTAKANPDGPLGAFLRRLAGEIADDREALVRIMETLEVGRDRVKVASGWTAEKIGRLKPNGRLTGYSPLSRVLELEGLIVGVNGKRALWQSLLGLAPHEPRLDATTLERLADRAESQAEELRRHHRPAAAEAFAGRPAAAASS